MSKSLWCPRGCAEYCSEATSIILPNFSCSVLSKSLTLLGATCLQRWSSSPNFIPVLQSKGLSDLSLSWTFQEIWAHDTTMFSGLELINYLWLQDLGKATWEAVSIFDAKNIRGHGYVLGGEDLYAHLAITRSPTTPATEALRRVCFYFLTIHFCIANFSVYFMWCLFTQTYVIKRVLLKAFSALITLSCRYVTCPFYFCNSKSW